MGVAMNSSFFFFFYITVNIKLGPHMLASALLPNYTANSILSLYITRPHYSLTLFPLFRVFRGECPLLHLIRVDGMQIVYMSRLTLPAAGHTLSSNESPLPPQQPKCHFSGRCGAAPSPICDGILVGAMSYR